MSDSEVDEESNTEDSEVSSVDSSTDDDDDDNGSDRMQVVSARQVHAWLFGWTEDCQSRQRLKSVRIKNSNCCQHCGYGGNYYDLLLFNDEVYAIIKYFSCATYNMSDGYDIKWTGTTLSLLPAKYKFMKP